MKPVRTCIGCRKSTDAATLLRCVARNGQVVADPFARLPGRGAWLHPTPACFALSVKRRSFGRAFRVAEPLELRDLREHLTPHQQQPQAEFLADSMKKQAD